MASKTIRPDQFEMAMSQIVKEIDGKLSEGSTRAIKKACLFGRKEVKAASSQIGLHQGKTYAKYVKGWSYRTGGSGKTMFGQIGNKNVPGLPHLIEKGHARVGGGRVAGRPHISTAADKTFEKLEEEIIKEVEKL